MTVIAGSMMTLPAVHKEGIQSSGSTQNGNIDRQEHTACAGGAWHQSRESCPPALPPETLAFCPCGPDHSEAR